MKCSLRKINKLVLGLAYMLFSIDVMAQETITLNTGIDNRHQFTLASAGDHAYFAIQISSGNTPANATELQFSARSEDGSDVQLLGQYGSMPGSSSFDCQGVASHAQCVITGVAAGWYYYRVTATQNNQTLWAYGNFDTPVSRHGVLNVCTSGPAKHKLCNAFGDPVQLRGMGTHGIQWFNWQDWGGTCYNNDMMELLATEWNIDAIRVSLYTSPRESDYENNPDHYHQMIDKFIAAATSLDLYVLIDWHMLRLGDPNAPEYTGPYPWGVTPAYCTGEAANNKVKCFFKYFTDNWASADNILYEIANEPNINCDYQDATQNCWSHPELWVTWNEIDAYAEDVGTYLRNNVGKDVIILVGTSRWSTLGVSENSGNPAFAKKGIDEILANPVVINGSTDNIMYSFHQYAMTQVAPTYLNALRYAHAKLPVYVTESGSQNAAGTYHAPSQFTPYADFMYNTYDKYMISWSSWNFSDDSFVPPAGSGEYESNAVWDAYQCQNVDVNNKAQWYPLLKPSGEYILGRLLSEPVVPQAIQAQIVLQNSVPGQVTPLLTLSVDAWAGDPADWWLVYKLESPGQPDVWKSYTVANGWNNTGIVVSYQSNLSDMVNYAVPAADVSAPGHYTFYFGVDMIMDGELDMEHITYATATLTTN